MRSVAFIQVCGSVSLLSRAYREKEFGYSFYDIFRSGTLKMNAKKRQKKYSHWKSVEIFESPWKTRRYPPTSYFHYLQPKNIHIARKPLKTLGQVRFRWLHTKYVLHPSLGSRIGRYVVHLYELLVHFDDRQIECDVHPPHKEVIFILKKTFQKTPKPIEYTSDTDQVGTPLTLYIASTTIK